MTTYDDLRIEGDVRIPVIAGMETGEQGPDPKEQLAAAWVTQLTVNIGSATAEALQAVAKAECITVTEALRRLVSYGDLLYRVVKIDGNDVLFRYHNETRRVILL